MHGTMNVKKKYVLYFFFVYNIFTIKQRTFSVFSVALSLSFSLADAIANTCTVVHVHSVEQMSMTWFVCYFFIYEAAILPLS
jgi:hypothetical protein